MTECMGSEVDVYILEFDKRHNHIMVFERMNIYMCGYLGKYEMESIKLVKMCY